MNKKARAELRDELASLQHAMWSEWMRALWRFVERNERGEDILALPARARLLRLMNEPFSQLDEDEKEQDRAEADRILAVLDKYCAAGRGQQAVVHPCCSAGSAQGE